MERGQFRHLLVVGGRHHYHHHHLHLWGAIIIISDGRCVKRGVSPTTSSTCIHQSPTSPTIGHTYNELLTSTAGQTSQVCVNLFLRANNSGFCIYTHCTPTMLHNNKSINYDVIDSDQPFSMRSRVDTNYTFWSCPPTSAHVWTYHCQKPFTYCTAILRLSNGSSCKIHLVSDTRRDPCNSISSHDAYL